MNSIEIVTVGKMNKRKKELQEKSMLGFFDKVFLDLQSNWKLVHMGRGIN